MYAVSRTQMFNVIKHSVLYYGLDSVLVEVSLKINVAQLTQFV